MPEFLEFTRNLIILRGAPGSGKSTFAKLLWVLNPATVACFSADDFFTDSQGVYEFNHAALAHAHRQCSMNVQHAMIKRTPVIVVHNTSSKPSDIQPYLDLAAREDYKVFQMVLEGSRLRQNVHDVPPSGVEKHRRRLRSSFDP